jgi:ComF family protein
MVEPGVLAYLPSGNEYARSGGSCQLLKLSWVYSCIKNTQLILLPSVCTLCGVASHNDSGLCPDCRDELPYLVTACGVCAVPLSAPGICGHCQHRMPNFDRVNAVFHYVSPIDFFIQRLKFNGKLSYARLLGYLMANALEDRYSAATWKLPDLIIPVPLHFLRLRERGYNQALEIARPIAARFNIPIDYLECIRSRATELQSTLSGKERRQNVKDAFRISSLQADHVVIIDDVMTTGYTINELAGKLRKAGASRIDVWICARASHPG